MPSAVGIAIPGSWILGSQPFLPGLVVSQSRDFRITKIS